MQVQVNTDDHIEGSAKLTGHVESVVKAALSRFADRITRVEVHLSDESNRSKVQDNDKRCVMEARLAGLQPITVSHQGADLEQAINGAADMMATALTRTLGRLDDHKGRTSYGGAETI